MITINNDLISDPEAQPPLWDDEVDWTGEVGDDAEPEGEGDAE